MGVSRLRKLIPVRYTDGHVDKIPSPLLNTLIETRKITDFRLHLTWRANQVEVSGRGCAC